MRSVAAVGLAALALVSCTAAPETSNSPGAVSSSKELTVVTHDSFTLPDTLKAKFEKQTGMKVKYVAPGDAGALVNQLILTKDSPLGDVVYGIDNAFASRADAEGILTDYATDKLPPSSRQFDAEGLTPIDFGDVCINADKSWFAAKKLPVPTSLDDLVKSEYKDLLVVTNPASSSPGLAFLIATVGAKGDGYLDYWRQLKANGVKIASGWTEAYNTDFSGGDGKGPRPLVLSYATSPAYTVKDGVSRTEALLGTCFRQIEYAGVLKGTKNEAGARQFIDFMLSPEVQAAIPTNLYMYPVVSGTPLPEEWRRFAQLPNQPIMVEQDEIGRRREEWIKAWTEAIG